MIDVFSDLAAQGLGSMPVIQPLIPPLFAPALALVSDMAPPVSNAIPLKMPEATLWETEPATLAAPEMLHPSEVVETPVFPERRAMPSDLVPAEAAHRDTPALSRRSLIQNQRPVHDWDEQAPAASAGHPQGDGPTIRDLSRKPLQAQAAPPPQRALEAAVMPPFPFPNEQGHTGEKSGQVPPAKHEPLSHGQAEASRSSKRDEIGTDKDREITADTHVAPAVVPPPSIQPLIESERVVGRDDVVSQQPLSLTQAQQASISTQATVERRDVGQAQTMPQVPSPTRNIQETPIRPLLDSLPSLAESRPETLLIAHLHSGPASSPGIPVIPALPTLVAGQSTVVSGRPGNTSMLDERGEAGKAGGLENADRRGRSVEKPRDEGDGVARGHAGNHAQQAPLDVWPDSPGQEVGAAKQKDEAQLVPLIQVNIGRVVVRGSTPAPQHNQTAAQKRVLRPAQSLQEYLKQRERGGR